MGAAKKLKKLPLKPRKVESGKDPFMSRFLVNVSKENHLASDVNTKTPFDDRDDNIQIVR